MGTSPQTPTGATGAPSTPTPGGLSSRDPNFSTPGKNPAGAHTASFSPQIFRPKLLDEVDLIVVRVKRLEILRHFSSEARLAFGVSESRRTGHVMNSRGTSLLPVLRSAMSFSSRSRVSCGSRSRMWSQSALRRMCQRGHFIAEVRYASTTSELLRL